MNDTSPQPTHESAISAARETAISAARESAMSAARRRYRKLMLAMLGITFALIGISMAWLFATGTPMHLHFVLAVSLGIFFSLMLGAALMGLVFFSNASGADEAAASESERDR